MYPALTAPMEGRTNWKVFAAVMGGGLAAVGAMTGLVMNGMIALADTAIPVPFTVTAQTINGDLDLEPGATPTDHQGTAVVTMTSATLKGMNISKTISTPIGNFQISISAGTDTTPVSATDMQVYATSLGGTEAEFTKGLTMNADTGGMKADSLTMTGAKLQVPYLVTSSITLPNMSLSIGPASSGNSTGS